eukprot:XP_011616766.1 PREDICTED: uncharacterized protein LOC101074536 isoform X1 [Takifugu rubripes]
MRRRSTDPPEPEGPPSPPLPADHVLDSGAVLFPGAFDQHGCPLIVFPVDGQTKLSTELSKAEVVDFINYFQRVHNKKLEKECLVSVVADLRHASLPTVRFITETLLLLELHKRTVHSVYIIQPQKKEVLKLLMKLLTPSKFYPTTLKKIIVKEISELSNYIDKSQLPSSLGGYLIYCHQSWVSFVKEIDAFIQEFVSVVQRLPSCISTLYSLSRMPLPFTFTELQNYFSTNESTFQQLRRELGLDELLRHCETVVEKLHYPEKDPCYLAMAGTALFTHTTFDMLQNHSRITAAVEKVELLWEQAFAKARLQLQVFQLQEDALQITEQIKSLHQEKLQPYRIAIAKDDAAAVKLLSEFEATIYTPAVALVHCAEDVIHTLAKIMPLEGQTKDHWVLDLERLKEKFYSAVQFILQTLRAVSKYHRHYQKANCWYSLVLHDNVLQELLSGVNGDAGSPWRQRKNWGVLPAWRQRISYFLKKNPPPDNEELVYLAHLSSIIPDEKVQQAGKQMSQRCITLRKLLLSPEPVAVGYLQRALQWQYELLRSSYSSADCAAVEKGQDVVKYKDLKEMTVPRMSSAAGLVSADSTPLSLSSFDSGFDGLGNGQPEVLGGRKRLDLCGVTEIRGSEKCTLILPQLGKDGSACISDTEVHGDEFDCGSVGGSSGASIQIVPKAAVDSLNFEIRVKRSAALPSNPWLSLPVDNLENSYTITVTPNPTPQKKNHQLQEPPDPFSAVGQLFGSKDQPAQTEGLSSTRPRASKSQDCVRSGRSTLEDPELSPVCHILSSTLTEERDKTLSTTEGGPTLLWDSYDLHEQNQDAVDRSIDLSLNDWDVKERETLREVERILDRTDKILEKEENILAQEAVLDAMLSSENQQQQWLWDEENWAEGMSSRELAEAGVLGLDDNLLPAESDSVWEPNSTASAREIKTSDCYNKMIPEAHAQVFHSSSDLLTELRQVHTLDEMIVEEKLKIHMFRQKEMPDEELPRSKILDSNRLSVRKEREAFRLQLEKEKQEVALLEKSLENECKVKERSKKVIRCSIMAKTRAEKKDEKVKDLPGSSKGSHEMALVCSDSEVLHKTEHLEEASEPNILTENASNHPIQLPASQADHLECETSLIRRNSSDLKPVEPLECVFSENPVKPEASLTPELRPDGAFDPGGNCHVSPLPNPRKLLVAMDKPPKDETPCSTDMQIPPLSSITELVRETAVHKLPELPESADNKHGVIHTANVKEHQNNNKQMPLAEYQIPSDQFSERNIKDDDDSLVFKALGEGDLLSEEMNTLSPVSRCLLPEPPFELQLSREDQDADASGGLQPSDWMKVSGCESTDGDITVRTMKDFKTPIVLDTGSGFMKAGFADEDLPNVVFPTIIGMPKYEEIMNGRAERETYIGHEAQHMRGVLALKHPIKNGIIQNWDEMEKIWHHTFLQMRVDPEDHPVLLTEAAMNPLENRRRMVEIMFECFNVPFTYVAMQAVLSLYASGRSTGVVFDSGDGVSHSVPVFDGHYLPHAVQRFPLAGVDVTLHLIKLLQEQGVCMRTTAEVEIVREMKEKCCRVALNYEAELCAGGSSCREMHFTMPDGQIVTVNTERFRAPEILFKPELIGRDHCGIHESLLKSILSSDIDLRRSLLQNIVLSGGNTLLSGFPERLQAEIQGLLPPDMGECVHVISPVDRDFSVWSGGAMLANLQSFNLAWISLEEYEEHGPHIVHRKCF